MLHVDDHIDDLFRRAAEDYPLNIDGANFDKVMARMQDDQDKGHNKHNNKPFLHLLWLLLLVPLPWLCNKEPRQARIDETALSTSENNAPAKPEVRAPKQNTATTAIGANAGSTK